jgi:hypothetical protein
MTINQSKTRETHEASFSLQPYLWGFVVVMTALLVLMPLWPTLISSLEYSFGGQAPKIYWYLSRATGFVALTILWVSMALFDDAGQSPTSAGTKTASTPSQTMGESSTRSESSTPSPKVEQPEPRPSEEVSNKAHAPLPADSLSAALPAPEDKIGSHALVEKYETGSGKNKINVRIFREPPEPEGQEPGKDAPADHGDLNTEKLTLGLKKDFLTTPSQPSPPADLPSRHIKFLDEE